MKFNFTLRNQNTHFLLIIKYCPENYLKLGYLEGTRSTEVENH